MCVNDKFDFDNDFKGKLGDVDTSTFAFALNYWRCSNILCVSNKFDFDKDFKGKIGDEDEVVGMIQNDELSTVQKCFIFLLKIENLKV